MTNYYLAIEIGGTNLRYGVVDEAFQVLEFQKEPSSLLSDAEDKGAYIEHLVSPYLERYGREQFQCITLSLASLMNRERTINYNSPHIRGLDHISLTEILSKQIGLPAFMERDVNTALLYEIWHRHMDSSGIIIGIFIGTGLGNAMCIDGKIYIGHSGSACELGHIPVPGFARDCGCGKKRVYRAESQRQSASSSGRESVPLSGIGDFRTTRGQGRSAGSGACLCGRRRNGDHHPGPQMCHSGRRGRGDERISHGIL